jgi:hypothetical protein
MQNYCYNADTDTNVVGGPAPADCAVEERSSQTMMDQRLEKLRLGYGLKLEVTARHEDPKSVREEYSVYIAQVSSAGMDILKFWEVCGMQMTGDTCEQSLTGLPRSTRAPSLLSLQ